jgi:hypothetical protein
LKEGSKNRPQYQYLRTLEFLYPQVGIMLHMECPILLFELKLFRLKEAMQ